MVRSTRPCAASLAARFRHSRSGNIATMTALVMPLAIVLCAVGIDSAALYTERRQAQSLVDLAAIAAAANLGKAEAAVLATLHDNGISDAKIVREGVALPDTQAAVATVTPGRYVPLASTAASARFQAGALPYNAVKVTLRKAGTLHFGSSLIKPPMIATEATASLSAQAAFSIGSRLASLKDGILNQVLGGLVGGKLSLKLMDYEALVSTDVELFDFLDALATRVNVTAGSYSDVLDASATVGQIAAAMASVPGSDPQAKLALQAVENAAGQAKIQLSKLFDLGPLGALAIGSRPSGLTAKTSIMDILSASAALANGNRQVDVDLGASVPGLLSTKLALAIGEPPQSSPWFSIGEAGAIVRTAQTRLFLEVNVGLAKVLPVLDIIKVRLPIYLEVAFAEAKLAGISCPGGKPAVSIAARPGIFELRIADINAGNFRNNPVPTARVEIARLPAISVTAQASIASSNLSYTDLAFSQADINSRTVKSVSTRNITQSLVKSLIGKPGALKVEVLGLDLLGLGNILLPALSTALQPVTAIVDELLHTVLAAVGIHLGEADVRVNGATCGHSVLVQ
ncbi:pilus assembly protein TadG-related protein [Pseudaminobacter sp. NGMCC 1.201702]|uniref:pilus assembly protein TadG-related protein n=1 Tax=Pseudaminobacter sp. NGMCC 1.201702 TaxID=3391825 RepID=UPI0039EEED74